MILRSSTEYVKQTKRFVIDGIHFFIQKRSFLEYLNSDLHNMLKQIGL